jgi:hypothetical protein
MENIDSLNADSLNIDSLNAVIQIDSLKAAIQPSLEAVAQSSFLFLRHPLLCAIVGGLVGIGGLLVVHVLIINGVMKKRDQKRLQSMGKAEEKRQKREEVIKVADELNVALSRLFWKIREPDITMDKVDEAILKALESRSRLEIMVETHSLKRRIVKEYNEIIWELYYLRRSINNFQKEDNEEWKKNDEPSLKAYIETLIGYWGIQNIEKENSSDAVEDVKFQHFTSIRNVEDLPYPYNIYFIWNQAIWDKFQLYIYSLINKKPPIKIEARPVKPLEQEKK